MYDNTSPNLGNIPTYTCKHFKGLRAMHGTVGPFYGTRIPALPAHTQQGTGLIDHVLDERGLHQTCFAWASERTTRERVKTKRDRIA